MERILAHLQDALPNEGCGLIAGETSADGVHMAQRFFAGENIDRSPTRFTMDGAQVIAAFKEIRAMGLDLGAIVHSHPTSVAEPSPTDLREAFYTDALAVIVSFQEGLPDTRAWTWCPEKPDEPFQECTIEIRTGE